MRSPTPQRSSTSASCPISGPDARVWSEAPSADLRQLYAAQLAAHRFTSDDAQLAVVRKLEELRQRVLAAKPRAGIELPRWLPTVLLDDAGAPLGGVDLWG